MGLVRGVLELRSERFDEAHRDFSASRERSLELKMPQYVARTGGYLGQLLARTGRLPEARAIIDESLEQLQSVGQAAWLAELMAISAHLYATAGDVDRARETIAACDAAAARTSLELYSETGWHLTAACSLIGDLDAARRFAEKAAKCFADDALQMDPELAATFARLPWNRHLVAYLAGRDVPMRIDERASGKRTKKDLAKP